MKSPNPVFTLHTKKLTTIWNPSYFHNNTVKYVTGEYMFNSLFTVSCYATNTDIAMDEQLFAQNVCKKILTRIASATDTIVQMKKDLEDKSTGFFVRPFEPNDTFTLPYDQSRHGRETAKLLKLFLVLDQYFLLLNRLRYEEEITPDFSTNQRNKAYKVLLSCLNDLHQICLRFHEIRKNPPEEVG